MSRTFQDIKLTRYLKTGMKFITMCATLKSRQCIFNPEITSNFFLFFVLHAPPPPPKKKNPKKKKKERNKNELKLLKLSLVLLFFGLHLVDIVY